MLGSQDISEDGYQWQEPDSAFGWLHFFSHNIYVSFLVMLVALSAKLQAFDSPLGFGTILPSKSSDRL